MRDDRVFRVAANGTITGLWHDMLVGVGEAKVRRISEVEYNNDRQAWQAEISGGPLLTNFPTRQEALDAEVDFLNALLREGGICGDVVECGHV